MVEVTNLYKYLLLVNSSSKNEAESTFPLPVAELLCHSRDFHSLSEMQGKQHGEMVLLDFSKAVGCIDA